MASLSTDRPTINLDEIPCDLRERPQWVMWKDIDTRKMPLTVSGSAASSTDPTTWTSFDAATAAYHAGHYSGIGYVFSPDDPFIGIDLDGCRNPETGEVDEWAQEVIDAFHGTYAEVSPSGTGVKLVAKGCSPFDRGANEKLPQFAGHGDKASGIEVYDHGRYFALTGQRIRGVDREPQDAPKAALELVEKIVKDARAAREAKKATRQPAAQQHAPMATSVGDALNRCRAYVAKMPEAISGQAGSKAAFAVACECFRFGLSDSDAWQVLAEFNTRCVPEWTERELQHKLTDARNAVLTANEFGGRLRERFEPAATRTTSTPTVATTETNGKPEETAPVIRLRVTKASDVQIRPVEWLWPERIPLGKMTLLFGDPSCNKSTLSLAMAANVTHGGQWCDGSPCCTAGDVVICQAEDGASDTVVPRLRAAGADLDRVHLVDCAESIDGKEHSIRLDHHVPLIDDMLADLPDARLVIIDPISCFLGRTDGNDSGDVRGLLAPLAALAERRNVAVVMVSHMSKAQARGALQAVSGSHGFGAAVRAAWLVSRHPNNPDGDERIMVSAKNNLGRPAGGIGFSVTSVDVQGAGSQPAIAWSAEPCTLRADDVVSPKKMTKQELAVEWVKGLGLDETPMPSAEFQRLATEAGYPGNTARRALEEAGFESWKSGLGGGWLVGRKSEQNPFDEWNNRA